MIHITQYQTKDDYEYKMSEQSPIYLIYEGSCGILFAGTSLNLAKI